MFNGLPKHCRARCATPHGVVGAAASPTATDRESLTGFGGRGDGLGGSAGMVPITPCRNRHRYPPCGGGPAERSFLPGSAPSVTAITHLPVPHRPHPPRFRHPHRADGLHGAGGGDGGRGGVMSHLSEMPRRESGMISVRVSHLSVSSCVLSPHGTPLSASHCAALPVPHSALQTSPHCAASPLVWC